MIVTSMKTNLKEKVMEMTIRGSICGLTMYTRSNQIKLFQSAWRLKCDEKCVSPDVCSRNILMKHNQSQNGCF